MLGLGCCQHQTCSTLLWHNYPAFVGTRQKDVTLTRDELCTPAEEAPPLQATHYTLGSLRGGATSVARGQMFRHQMTAPASCQQGSHIKHL